MLAHSLAIPISNGNEDHPDPTCSKPKTSTKRIRTEHKVGSRSTRDTLKATEQRLESSRPRKRMAEMVQTEQPERF